MDKVRISSRILTFCLDFKNVLLFLVVTALVYMVAHMDTVGEIVLDIIFEQFYFELILDTVFDLKRSFYQARGAVH